jgi:hypothetical protein
MTCSNVLVGDEAEQQQALLQQQQRRQQQQQELVHLETELQYNEVRLPNISLILLSPIQRRIVWTASECHSNPMW